VVVVAIRSVLVAFVSHGAPPQRNEPAYRQAEGGARNFFGYQASGVGPLCKLEWQNIASSLHKGPTPDA